MVKKKKETELKGLKSTRYFLTLASNDQVRNICLGSQKFQLLAVGGKKSAKMKKWNKFSLFVRAPSPYLKDRSYFTSLITFWQRIMGSAQTERIVLPQKVNCSFRWKELHRINQGSSFFRSSFNNITFSENNHQHRC